MTPTDYSGFVSEEQLSPSHWRLHDVLSPLGTTACTSIQSQVVQVSFAFFVTLVVATPLLLSTAGAQVRDTDETQAMTTSPKVPSAEELSVPVSPSIDPEARREKYQGQRVKGVPTACKAKAAKTVTKVLGEESDASAAQAQPKASAEQQAPKQLDESKEAVLRDQLKQNPKRKQKKGRRVLKKVKKAKGAKARKSGVSAKPRKPRTAQASGSTESVKKIRNGGGKNGKGKGRAEKKSNTGQKRSRVEVAEGGVSKSSKRKATKAKQVDEPSSPARNPPLVFTDGALSPSAHQCLMEVLVGLCQRIDTSAPLEDFKKMLKAELVYPKGVFRPNIYWHRQSCGLTVVAAKKDVFNLSFPDMPDSEDYHRTAVAASLATIMAT